MGLYTFNLNNPIRYVDPDGRDIDWAGVVSSIACGIVGGCGVAHAPRPDERGQPRLTADEPDGYGEGAAYAAGGAAIGKVGKWAIGGLVGWAFGKAASETAEAATKGLAKVADDVADDAIRMGDDLADDASRIVDDVADDAARGGAKALPSITGAADDVIVLGRQVDTAVAQNWPGHKVLSIDNWTLARNDNFIATAIERGQNAYLASPMAGNLVQQAGRYAGQPTVFAREIGQLLAAGYKQVGNYLVHPNNLGSFVP
jgi:hypothetical protein